MPKPKRLVAFPGVAGIGPKTATKLVSEIGTLEEIYADLEKVDLPENAQQVVGEIFRDVSGNRGAAAAKIQAFVQGGGDLQAVIDAARRLVFVKGRDAHDYKFNSAVLEDCRHVSPQWRATYLALSAFNFRGSGDRDSGLVHRTRQALSG